MRNERTPRTLAETTFFTGYPLHTHRSPWREVPVYAGLVGLLALVIFVLPLLWHLGG